jgi:hypothetical protein
MPDLIRHPVAELSEKALNSAKASLRARVKPGMTKQQYGSFCELHTGRHTTAVSSI